MPLRGYTTDRRPPRNRDHLLAHPFSIGIALWQVLAGGSVLASLLWGFTVSQSIALMPQWLMVFVGVLLILGGVGIVRGLLDDSDDLMVGWRTERTGLVLSATAWASYSVTVAVSYPASILSWTLSLTLAGAQLIRCVATVLEERRVRTRIGEHPQP